MRIAHVSDCYLPRLGGIEIQVHDLAGQQIAAGHDVQILTCTPQPRAAQPQAVVPVIRFPVGLTGWPTIRGAGQLRAMLRSGAFDAVHIHSSVVSPFAWAAAHAGRATGGIPTVLTMHSVLPGQEHLLRLSDQVVGWSRWPVEWTAVSEVAAAPLRQVLGDTSVSVLSNGIDPDLWTTPAPRPEAGVRELTIVSVMRLSRRKRPMALLRILAGIRAIVPKSVPIRAVLIGEGPARARIEQSLRAGGMRSWVTLTGRLTRAEIRPWLAAADVFLAPAHQESFGIAALEARCAGVPVVAMAGGGVAEFVRHGQEGLLVHSDDEMARATADLLLSPRLPAMQEHNRRSIPEMTWPNVVGRSLQLYQKAGATAAQGVRQCVS